MLPHSSRVPGPGATLRQLLPDHRAEPAPAVPRASPLETKLSLGRPGAAIPTEQDALLEFAYRPVGDPSAGIEVTPSGLANLFATGKLDPCAFECRQRGASSWVSLVFMRRHAGSPSDLLVDRTKSTWEVWGEWSTAFAWGLGCGSILGLIFSVLF